MKKTKDYKIVVCGLDRSGKSTIISFLQTGRFVQHTPTMGKKKSELEVEGTKISLFDMGGQTDFRKFWIGEMKNSKCVIFVLDKSDPSRFEEAKEELDVLLPYIQKHGLSLIFIANKHDIAQNLPLGKIITQFGLYELENFEIFETSAKTGYGMADTFAKIYSVLTGNVIKKSVVAKAVSIWNKNGLPLVTRANDEEFDQKVVEGGFMSAITNFANLQLDSNSITFKSEKSGTYIVIRSENFIGSLLWNNDLSVPIEESEDALKELLTHLEATSNCEDKESVEMHVSQYCTNLM